MRKISWKSPLAIFLIGISFIFSNQASAAPTVLIDGIGTGCNTTYSSGYFESNRYVATSNIVITGINYLFGSGSTTNFSSSYMYIFSDNTTYNAPQSVLETFTPTTLTGSGSLTAGQYTGSYSLSAGTKIWIVPSANPTVLPWCYWTGVNASSLAINGLAPDTSTSGSNASFRKVYYGGTSIPAASSWNYSGDTNQIWQLKVLSSVTPAVVITTALQSGLRSAIYRTTSPIQANVDTQSKVTFYANGKYIAGCRNVMSSAGIALCNWKPTIHGNIRIYATAVPISGSYTSSTSTPIGISVTSRVNTR